MTKRSVETSKPKKKAVPKPVVPVIDEKKAAAQKKKAEAAAKKAEAEKVKAEKKAAAEKKKAEVAAKKAALAAKKAEAEKKKAEKKAAVEKKKAEAAEKKAAVEKKKAEAVAKKAAAEKAKAEKKAAAEKKKAEAAAKKAAVEKKKAAVAEKVAEKVAEEVKKEEKEAKKEVKVDSKTLQSPVFAKGQVKLLSELPRIPKPFKLSKNGYPEYNGKTTTGIKHMFASKADKLKIKGRRYEPLFYSAKRDLFFSVYSRTDKKASLVNYVVIEFTFTGGRVLLGKERVLLEKQPLKAMKTKQITGYWDAKAQWVLDTTKMYPLFVKHYGDVYVVHFAR